MADPKELEEDPYEGTYNYDYKNTPAMKAARGALSAHAGGMHPSWSAEDEEIPEGMPDATVMAPFEQPGVDQTLEVPNLYPDLVNTGPTVSGGTTPKGYAPAGEQAEIIQSPRAAAGGPGETMEEIESIAAEDTTSEVAEAEEAAEAALGEDIDLDYAKRLLALSEGGIIGELPPEVTRLLRNFIRLSNRVTEYEQASELSAREMER